MHEFSLMKDLMQKITSLARENDARKVVRVRVRLGALCHISAQHFGEHFREAATGTVAEGARLDIVESRDEADPLAQDILLESVDVESP
jgi:hydrogenase nickel incorporation protein HypA/HybF